MSGTTKKVKNSRKTTTNKIGGYRGGWMSGLVSTSARAGIHLLGAIKRRTGFGQNDELLKIISSGGKVDDLIQAGFTEADLIETVGIQRAVNFVLNDDTPAMLDAFKDEGVSEEDLENAGVVFDNNGNANFENLTIDKLLETSMTPSSVVIMLTNIHEKQIVKNVPAGKLSLLAKAQVAADVSTIYDKLDDDKQQEVKRIMSNMGLSQELAFGDFLGILRGFGFK